MKAFIIVDVQNDFLSGALPVPEGVQVIPIINALQQNFTCVLATKDWHPKGHISFASTHGKKPGEMIEVEGRPQRLWPDHCVQESWGAEFPASLHADKVRKVFYKGVDPLVDSYSTFYDNAHLLSTGLGEYLHSSKIDELYIAGLATDYCVKFSVLDARRQGFKIYLIKDGCRGIDSQATESALNEMEEAGAQIIESSELLLA